eukprot:scaffold89631_cov22-Tisochrysis_lutea.AAC.1
MQAQSTGRAQTRTVQHRVSAITKQHVQARMCIRPCNFLANRWYTKDTVQHRVCVHYKAACAGTDVHMPMLQC